MMVPEQKAEKGNPRPHGKQRAAKEGGVGEHGCGDDEGARRVTAWERVSEGVFGDERLHALFVWAFTLEEFS